MYSLRWILLIALSLLLTGSPAGAAAKIAGAHPEPLIEITLKTSRDKPTAGSGLGVMADITNLSDSTVYLNQKNIALVLPPELEGPLASSTGWWGLFPTETYNKDDPWDLSIALRPDDTYRVFWTTRPESNPDTSGLAIRMFGRHSVVANVSRQVRNELGFLFFTPGEYVITVDAKYWTNRHLPKDNYRTLFQSRTIQVETPQFVILFGASVGGLIAYFILPRGRRRLVARSEHDRGLSGLLLRLPTEAVGVVGSIFLSAIITILLARISETQFLVRITVSDVWGGVAIGFIANYAGTRFLVHLLSKIPEPQG